MIFFNGVLEESEVADLTSRNKKIFATKAISTRSNFLNQFNSSNEGYEIFVPKKAITDNRSYETFNWRLVAKVTNRVNVNEVNYGDSVDSEANIRQKVINCTVLCTGPDYQSAISSGNTGYINPYIFNRLSNSSFNLSSYSFVNPKADTNLTPNSARYWMTNIDQIENLEDYDIVAWSPTSPISAANAIKIRSFIENRNGTVLLDLSSSSLTPDAAAQIYPYLTLSSSTVSMSNWEYNTSNVFIDELQNNGWPISDNVFEAVNDQVYYGIFGNAVNSVSNNRKSFKYFNSPNITSSNIVLKENTNNSNSPIFVSVEHRATSNSLSRGLLLATTAPVMKYCNDIYQSSSVFNQALSNSSLTQRDQGNVLATAAIEGPFKILYNTALLSTTSRMQRSRTLDIRSSTYYVTSSWRTNYVLNGDVLLDDEVSEYSLIPDSNVNDELILSKNLTEGYNLSDLYKRTVYDSLPDQYSILAQDISLSNVEFYIESTNKDVKFNNLTLIENDSLTNEVSDIPSSHSLYRAYPTQYNSSLFAYTQTASIPFEIPSGYGAYVLKEKNSLIPTEENSQIRSGAFKSYPFSLSSYSTYVQSSEVPLKYDATWTANVLATGSATLSRKKTITTNNNIDVVDNSVFPLEGYSSVDVDDNSIIRSIKDPMARISSPKNNFFYSGDIEITKYSGQYGTDPEDRKTGDFVKYIQYTLANSGISSIKNIKIDGIYGNQTKSYVSIFQQTKNLIYTDGGVDSETKSYLIRVWKDLRKNNLAKYLNTIDKITKENPQAVVFIIQGVDNPELSELANSDRPYRRISFSGSLKDGPKGIIKDTIYVKVPQIYSATSTENQISNVKINSITITPGIFAGASKYKGIKVSKIICAPSTQDNRLDGAKTYILNSGTNFFSSARTFNVNNIAANDAVWFAIQIEGGPLGGIYGNLAEGYSLADVRFSISYTKGSGNQTTTTVETNVLPFTMTYSVTGSVRDISVNSPKTIDLSGNNLTKQNVTLGSVQYPTFYEAQRTENLVNINPNLTSFFSNTKYNPPISSLENDQYTEESVTLDLSSMTHTIQSGPVISSAISNGVSYTASEANQYIDIDYTNQVLTLSSSALGYENLIGQIDQVNLSNYWLLKQDGSIIKNSKNNISVLDGLLLLCANSEDPSLAGKPTGFDLPMFTLGITDGQEVNIDYGSFVVTNNSPINPGLLWGFYDNRTKEFLGTSIEYLEYINRGKDNVYIGVMATDANTSLEKDFIGPLNANAVQPVAVPQKVAYPIYAVRYKNTAKISIKQINGNLNKFQQWPLIVSSGSFTKDFTIDKSYGWTTWLSKYKGKKLRAFYSTSEIYSVPWSVFLGSPYVDVRMETPIALSKKSIKLRSAPIAYLLEPSYNAQGKITYFVNVYLRNSEDDPWIMVDHSKISSINAKEGIIDFTSSIVPSDIKNIYVDYTCKSNGIPLKQVGGYPIPLNPFLNKDIVEYDKSLYIYIKPKTIQYETIGLGGSIWTDVPEYTYSDPIDFTYDTSIFNQYLSSSYDPFALPIATISYVNSFFSKDVNIQDLRIRGGGVKSAEAISDGNYSSLSIPAVLKQVPQAISFWDVYPALQESYPKGGFVIIKIPKETKDNFQDPNEIYSIIERNLTAGVAYRLQDMDGNDWESI